MLRDQRMAAVGVDVDDDQIDVRQRRRPTFRRPFVGRRHRLVKVLLQPPVDAKRPLAFHFQLLVSV